MTSKNVKYTCSECGSDNVYINSDSIWNAQKQEWESADFGNETSHCAECCEQIELNEVTL